MANRVPRTRARSFGGVDLNQVDPQMQPIVAGLQAQIDSLKVQVEVPDKPPIPEQRDRDATTSRIRALEDQARVLSDADAKILQAVRGKVAQFVIATLPTATGTGDYITGYLKGTQGEGSGAAQRVKIAKPQLLRRTPYDGQTYNGVAYVYSTNYARTAAGRAETVVPNYVVGDIIYATLNPEGGTAAVDENSDPIVWLDLNVDGRNWQSSAGGFIIGKITAHGVGQAYTISLYANGSTQAATSTGVACTVINVNASETLANNTWLVVTQLPGGTYEAIVYGVLA